MASQAKDHEVIEPVKGVARFRAALQNVSGPAIVAINALRTSRLFTGGDNQSSRRLVLPVTGAASSPRHRGQKATLLEEGVHDMGMDPFWANIRDIASRAEDHYEILGADLEKRHYGEWVSIEADTGEYVFGTSRQDACANFKARFGAETPSWTTRVGMPDYACGGIGPL